MHNKELRAIPRFDNEEQEREFWSKHDSLDYVDWKRVRRAKIANLKPTTRTVSIRLPETMLEDLRMLANKRDVPYQSLLKIYVAERIEDELRPNKAVTDAG
jgi:predicted DNA binding CopG/RHH family protein